MAITIVSTVELPEKAREMLRNYDVNLYELPKLGKEEQSSALSSAEILMCWCGREFDLASNIKSMPRLRVIQTFSQVLTTYHSPQYQVI